LTEEVKQLLHELEIDVNWKIEELEEKLTELITSKQDDTNNVEVRSIPGNFTWENNVEYHLFHLGKVGKMEFKLPEFIPNLFKGKLFIRSGNNGLQLIVDNVIFVGEDCENGKFISTSAKYYEITYENVGIHDENYAPNKQIVIAKVNSLPIGG
jgi:hypothetical protein